MNIEFSTATKNYLSHFYEILDELLQELDHGELMDSISYNVVIQMIPLQKAAAELSRNLLQHTSFLPLQRHAAHLIEAESVGREAILSVLDGCIAHKNTPQELALYLRRFQQIAQTMLTEMENACTANDLSLDFMEEIIPLHRGAAQVAENALRYPLCPELVPILQEFISTQNGSVEALERLLACFRSLP